VFTFHLVKRAAMEMKQKEDQNITTAVDAGVAAAERQMRLVGVAVRDEVLAAQERAITAAEVRCHLVACCYHVTLTCTEHRSTEASTTGD